MLQKLYLVVLIFSANSSLTLLADGLNDQISGLHRKIEQRIKMIKCISYAELTLDNYRELVDRITSDNKKPLFTTISANTGYNSSIPLNLEAVLERNRMFRSKYLEYIEWGANMTPERQTFQKDADLLNRNTADLLAFLSKSAESEALILYYLSKTRQEFVGLRRDFVAVQAELAKNNCSVANIGVNFPNMIRLIDSWVANLTYYGQVLTASRNIHYQLVNNSSNSIEQRYEKLILEKLGKSFQDLWLKATSLLALEKLLDEKLATELSLAASGPDGGKYSRFLDYEGALIFLSSRLEQLDRMGKNMRGYADLIDVNPYLIDLAGLKDSVEAHRERILKSGWQGAMQRQKLITEKRLEKEHLFSDDCIHSAQDHLFSIAGANSIDQFREVQSLYERTIEECSK
tara:strand:+ start:1838 stop:3046 length:1209 start_codon:yes stop_codon:yes gene_type:complete